MPLVCILDTPEWLLLLWLRFRFPNTSKFTLCELVNTEHERTIYMLQTYSHMTSKKKTNKSMAWLFFSLPISFASIQPKRMSNNEIYFAPSLAICERERADNGVSPKHHLEIIIHCRLGRATFTFSVFTKQIAEGDFQVSLNSEIRYETDQKKKKICNDWIDWTTERVFELFVHYTRSSWTYIRIDCQFILDSFIYRFTQSVEWRASNR